MREGVVEMPDEQNIEFVHILASLGFQRKVAKVFTFLAVAGESTSREIERGTDLRQPEVSIAMRTLRGENWVNEHDVKSAEGKGRPHKIYTLTTPIDDIVRIIEEEKQKKSAEVMKRIQRLKDLASS